MKLTKIMLPLMLMTSTVEYQIGTQCYEQQIPDLSSSNDSVDIEVNTFASNLSYENFEWDSWGGLESFAISGEFDIDGIFLEVEEYVDEVSFEFGLSNVIISDGVSISATSRNDYLKRITPFDPDEEAYTINGEKYSFVDLYNGNDILHDGVNTFEIEVSDMQTNWFDEDNSQEYYLTFSLWNHGSDKAWVTQQTENPIKNIHYERDLESLTPLWPEVDIITPPIESSEPNLLWIWISLGTVITLGSIGIISFILIKNK